jgi:hypothetical protein
VGISKDRSAKLWIIAKPADVMTALRPMRIWQRQLPINAIRVLLHDFRNVAV